MTRQDKYTYVEAMWGLHKQITNYQPVSLLPICSKIFEWIIDNAIYRHISDNNLWSLNQSGFSIGASCKNQFLSITHDIYHSFDEGFEARAILVDISRVFDKVLHERLVYKLLQYGCSGDLLSFLTDFPTNRKQRVIKTSVPQRSILGSLLFLLYINDCAENLDSNSKPLGDDTSLFSTVINATESNSQLSSDLAKINDWAYKWKMSFNCYHTKPAHELAFSCEINKTHHLYL